MQTSPASSPQTSPEAPQGTQTITLGGGCFWCTEAVFVKVRGITDVESGYSNGQTLNPSYEQVCTGRTGHNEVVKLQYDPAQISLEQILQIFFIIHDPTTLNRQGNDTGTQYRSGIYWSTPEQQRVATAFVAQLAQEKIFDRPIVTEIQPVQNYFAAEGDGLYALRVFRRDLHACALGW